MFWQFKDATAFNQNLCHFGVSFGQLSFDPFGMFEDSGCIDKDTPTDRTGPWCAVTTCL